MTFVFSFAFSGSGIGGSQTPVGRPPSRHADSSLSCVRLKWWNAIILSATNSPAIFAICDCDAHRGPQKSQRFPRQGEAVLPCDLRVRWKVASNLRFQAAVSEPKTPSFCRISGDLAPSTRKSLAIAIVRFWCAKMQ